MHCTCSDILRLHPGGPLGDMAFKKACQFLCIRFHPIGLGSIGFTFALDTDTDTDVFAEDATFCSVFTGVMFYGLWKTI